MLHIYLLFVVDELIIATPSINDNDNHYHFKKKGASLSFLHPFIDRICCFSFSAEGKDDDRNDHHHRTGSLKGIEGHTQPERRRQNGRKRFGAAQAARFFAER